MYSIIGDLGFDIIIENGEIKKSVGGSGYHSLVGAILVNRALPKCFISCVGYDFDYSEIKAMGICTKWITHKENEDTTKFVIDYREGKRSIEILLGASKNVMDLGIEELLDNDLIFLTATDPFKQEYYIDYIVKHGYKGLIMLDVIDIFCEKYKEQTIKVINKSNIVFMNEEEKCLLEINPCDKERIIIVKKAERGADIFFSGKKYHSEFYVDPKKVKNTTGAGDILAGAFTAYYNEFHNVLKSLDVAVKFASLSVEYNSSKDFLKEMGF